LSAGQELGFTMSTQRRASRMLPATKTNRAEIWRLTAPLVSIICLAWAWFCTPATKRCCRGHRLTSGDQESPVTIDREATNTLLLDSHNEILASLESRSGSPPSGRSGDPSPSGLRVPLRSSLSHRPRFLPVRAHLRTTLPIAPAGEVRWAERHDGKRDLYFQHAA